ncbi:MAG: aspartate dehydrogenase domain-containing protein [Candidatus Omnitrophota bacterium]|jgi:aspartate dehydrogenase
MKTIKVGIIGCGVIGSAVAQAVGERFPRSIRVTYLCDHNKERALWLRSVLGRNVKILTAVQLIRLSDVVVEAASGSISASVARQALQLGKRILIMSVVGLLEIKNWSELIKKSRGRVWIPSGAITGVDGLIAASQARVRKVQLVTRKPPQGLQGAPYFLKHRFPVLKGVEEKRVFRGTALAAAKAFPQNINVAAVLSLAGIGPKKTMVEIWTSRAYRSNRHEVSVEGDFGKMQTVTTNIPSPKNPKTSYLAVLSAIASLKEMVSSLQSGT